MKVYNTTVHEGTQYTPHELVFGRSARVLTNSILPNDKSNESYSKYGIALFRRIFNALARENLEHAKIICKLY